MKIKFIVEREIKSVKKGQICSIKFGLKVPNARI